MALDPSRVISELKELRALSEDENGAQRVAWTDMWLRAREWFETKLAGLPVEHHLDAAGNRWVTLAGKSSKALVLGSHLDSVPNGGWLDGSLGVMAGLEILRRFAEQYEGRPPVTIRLVDFADEEGARFGRSVLGSSAFAGTHTLDLDRNKKDRDGIRLEEAVRRCGFDFDRFPEAAHEQANIAAYLELHIEQGPVLEGFGLPLAAVTGTRGIERNLVTFSGQEAHAGTTPMTARRDAFAAAARFALAVRDIARRYTDAVCTTGSVRNSPGIATAVPGRCELTLDQRHLEQDILAKLLQEAREGGEAIAADEGCAITWTPIFRIEPVRFDPELIGLCGRAVEEISGSRPELPSGALHDAAEVARAGIPSVMLFVQSLRGLSHTPLEDTRGEHLAQAIRALDRLADKTVAGILRS